MILDNKKIILIVKNRLFYPYSFLIPTTSLNELLSPRIAATCPTDKESRNRPLAEAYVKVS